MFDVRNKVSHNENFTYDDAERRARLQRINLMEAISAGENRRASSPKMRDTILRTKFTEASAQRASAAKRSAFRVFGRDRCRTLPWREVVEPHQDVASGEFQQAEFGWLI